MQQRCLKQQLEIASFLLYVKINLLTHKHVVRSYTLKIVQTTFKMFKFWILVLHVTSSSQAYFGLALGWKSSWWTEETDRLTGDLDREPVSEFSWHSGWCGDWGCNLGWYTTGSWTGWCGRLCACPLTFNTLTHNGRPPLLTLLSIKVGTTIKETKDFQCISYKTAVLLKKYNCAVFINILSVCIDYSTVHLACTKHDERVC